MFKTEISTWFGFIATENESKFLRYFLQFFMFIQLIPNVIKFYRSAAIDSDIDMALESSIFVSAHFLINSQTYCCLWNASTIRAMSASLIDEMAQAMACDASKYYIKMDRIYFFLRKWFAILFFVSTQSIVIPPILICLHGHRTGNAITNEICSLPVKISLPFEIDSISVYLVVSTISAFSIYSLATCKIMNAEVFYRYGLHMIARCQHLIFLVNKFAAYSFDASLKSQAQLKLRLKEIIHFHRKTLDFFEQYALTASGIIFYEFTTMLGLLAATGTAMAIKPPVSGDMDSLKFTFVSMCAVSLMFVSSKMGNEISHKFAEISTTMYLASGWECWPIDFQRYAYVSLIVMQRPRYLTGYGLINCDFDTFQKTMKTVTSFILFIKEI